jgi:hypothetical protein
MTFFNTKEEVLDIEITPYGKFLLSKGEWKPAYYEFYDDDVIYDSEYAGISERQEEPQQRIKETARTKTNYSFEGAETRYKEYRKQLLETGKIGLPVLEKRKNLTLSSLPLANSSFLKESLPSWNVNVLNGEIANVTSTESITGLPNNINVLNLSPIVFQTTVKKDEDEQDVNSLRDINAANTRYEDGTYISIKDDYLLLDIAEENVDLLTDNFEIEIYLIESTEDGEKELPLKFRKEQESVVNGVYVETEEENHQDLNITPEFVEHYFDIKIDREIPSSVLCKHLSKSELEKLKTRDRFYINCEEESRVIIQQPIRTAVTQEDLDRFEDC